MLLRPRVTRTAIEAPPATVRFAAVGLGWVTTHRHIPWLGRTPGAQLVGVIDRNPNASTAWRRFALTHSAVS